MAPGGGLVVEGAGLEASVQDSDEPVRQPSQSVIVFDSAGTELVIEGAGTRRCVQGGEGLSPQCVDEPAVAGEPGGDDLFLPRGAGDRAGRGVVAAGFP